MSRRRVLAHGVALDVARTEIAARIRRVCADFPEGEFEQLVNRMAEIEVRYRLREDWLHFGASPGTPLDTSVAERGGGAHVLN